MARTFEDMSVETSVETGAERVWAERERWVARGVSTYAHVVVDHAHGAQVWDVEGKRYIDFAGGIGTLNAGHTPDEVVRAVQNQAEKLIHTCFSVAIYEPYVQVAKALCRLVPGDFPKKAMLVNSGAEAVENAVKIARAATGKPNVIAFQSSFHGRTYMAMTLTGRDRPYKEGFGPFTAGVVHADFPYSYRCPAPACSAKGHDPESCPIESGEALEQLLRSPELSDGVAAIIVEPVQGEGGFIVAPARFLKALRSICDREGIVLIADEVQTAFGRTGRMFALDHAGVAADIVVLAKSLGAGMPIGAVVGRADVMDAPRVGGIGGTFGGNPVSCAAALAVLDLFERDGLVDRGREIGERVRARFDAMFRRYPLIGEVRGLGAMLAMELVSDRVSKEPAAAETADIIHRCHDAGLIVIKAGIFDNVIRGLMPLVASDAELDEGLDILEREVARTELSG